ncbi:MAG: major capsid protein [Deltaproteobacteria bacterium]|nr:major capsid protein [Deltaproteobacteria bacterium]
MSLLNFDEFKWRAMTAAINQIKRASKLVKDLIFPDAPPTPSEYIDVDVVIGGRKIAPFVSPVQGGIVVEKMGREMRSIRVPRIRLKKPFTAEELLTTRSPGAGFYATGGSDLQAYRRKKIGQELNDLKNNRIMNTVEWMCCQALTGSLIYEGENISFQIDYQMPSSHKITLTKTDLWSDADNSDPISNLDDWANLIINALGYGPNLMIIGTNVAKALRKHSEIREILDNRRQNLGQFTWRATSNYIGNLDGIDIFRYGTKYDDLNDAEQNFWNPNYIALVATQARFTTEYAMILDLKANARVVDKYFSKSWEEEDPSNLWILAESRPLPVCWEPEAIVYAKVT